MQRNKKIYSLFLCLFFIMNIIIGVGKGVKAEGDYILELI